MRIKATIEFCSGVFYGIVRKSSGLPDGFGVFVASDGWVHCCKVKDGLYQERRIVSAKERLPANVLKITNKKFLIDGSILYKIEVFSDSGAQYDFFKDGTKSADFSARLNLCKDPKNWLSMKPKSLRYLDNTRAGLGEINDNNRLHGRGISIGIRGTISIGYW
jgi:hypothetical protein